MQIVLVIRVLLQIMALVVHRPLIFGSTPKAQQLLYLHAVVLPMVEEPIVLKSMHQQLLRTVPVHHALPISLLLLVTIQIVYFLRSPK